MKKTLLVLLVLCVTVGMIIYFFSYKKEDVTEKELESRTFQIKNVPSNGEK